MPQSLSLVIVHLVFGTKEREPFIVPDVRPALHAYLASVARNMECECHRVGGTADHVHLAIRLSRTTTIAALAERLKTSSSGWMKGPPASRGKFAWQRGYGCFSVNPKDLEALRAYIDDQDEHHRVRSFQEEYRMFLDRYGIGYNEAPRLERRRYNCREGRPEPAPVEARSEFGMLSQGFGFARSLWNQFLASTCECEASASEKKRFPSGLIR